MRSPRPCADRGSRASTALCLALLLLLAALVICAAVGSLGAEATRIFFVALLMSSLLAAMPLAVLWFLDRREREAPWLFASAFLWGGLIATTLALPINSTVLYFVGQWLEGNPRSGRCSDRKLRS